MLLDATPQAQDQDLGYGLGWLCGASLLAGIIVGAIAASKGRKRRAFQAFLQPVATIVTIILLILLMGALEALTGRWSSHQDQEFAFVMLIIGVLAAPLPVQYVLQKMRWPAVN